MSANGKARWHGRTLRCAIGRGGIARAKREGDGATPAGVFPVRLVLYRPDRGAPPQTELPAAPIARDDGWCDDPANPRYNQAVKLPFAGRHEVMWREDRLYDVVVILGYNDDPIVPGRGSAIFMHVQAPDLAPTEGCVALDRRDLLLVLGRAEPGSTITVADQPR